MKRNACNLEIQNIDYDKTKIEVNEDNESVNLIEIANDTEGIRSLSLEQGTQAKLRDGNEIETAFFCE